MSDCAMKRGLAVPYLLGALLLATPSSGCDDEDSGAAQNGSAQQSSDAGVAQGSSPAKASQSSPADPAQKITAQDLANPEQLKAFLPETAAGYQRRFVEVDTPREGSSILGSGASAMYQNGEGGLFAPISISISDLGTMAGMLRALPSRDVDRREGSNVSRTVDINGHRGLLSYEGDKQRGDVQVAIGGPFRLLLTVDGHGVPAEKIVEAARAVDLIAVKKAAEDGTLRQLTAEQKIPMPSEEQVKAMLPDQALGQSSAGARAWTMDVGEHPYVTAHANYGGQPYIRIHVFKMPEHAHAVFPPTHEKLLESFSAGSNQEQGEAEWDGHRTVYVLFPQQRLGMSRTYNGRYVIEVMGPADADSLREMARSIRLENGD